MKRGIIAVVVVVIIVIAAWLLFANGNSNNNSSLYGNNNNTPSHNTPAGNSSNNNTQNAASTPSQGKVSIANMAFSPSQVTVNKGDTVTWTNNDNIAHTVTDDLSSVGGPDSGDIAPGSTYSFTFNKTGSFQYHCSIHPSMRGTIVVK